MMDSLLTGAVMSASSSPRRQRCAPSRNQETEAFAAGGEPAGRFSGNGSVEGIPDEKPPAVADSWKTF